MKYINPFRVYSHLPNEMYTLFIARFINCVGGFIMPLLTLILTVKIGMSPAQAGLFATLSMVLQAPFVILGGKLTDRIGSKKTILISVVLSASVYFYCALQKPNVTLAILLIIAANLQAIAYPAYNTIVAEFTPREHVKRAYSLSYLGLNLGYAVGPMLGTFLFTNHLPLLFVLDALTTLFAGLTILLFIHNRNRLCEQQEHQEEQAVQNRSALHFFLHNLPLIVFSLCMLLFSLNYAQWYYLLPMQTAYLFGDAGVKMFGLLVTINALIVTLFTPMLTAITHRHRPIRIVALGGICYAVSSLLFAVNGPLIYFYISIVILTMGEIVITIHANSFLAERTPVSLLGRVNSYYSLVTGSGNALGPLIAGYILTATGYTFVWIVFAAVVAFGSVWMELIDRLQNGKKKNRN